MLYKNIPLSCLRFGGLPPRVRGFLNLWAVCPLVHLDGFRAPRGWRWALAFSAHLDRAVEIFAIRPIANLLSMSKEPTPNPPATLGDVLYAKSKAPVTEQDWVTLVQSIAAGDQLALHALYERSHRVVFTLIMRITANRETAEELTIDVFHDVWRRASRYDAANGTVLGWIMNQARSRAIDRLRFQSRKKRSYNGDIPPAEVAADPSDVIELREQTELLRAALAALTPSA